MKNTNRQEYHRAWYLKNRADKLRKNAAWAKQNRQQMSQLQKRWYRKNRKAHCKNCIRNATLRAKVSVEFRILRALRTRVWSALRDVYASDRTLDLIGCSVESLKAHLERQFRPGMTWENWGPVWHIDHRKPCASFDLKKAAHRKQCFHWSNLQPLWAEENRSKGAKI